MAHGFADRLLPESGPTFKVSRNSAQGKIVNTAVRATVGQCGRIEVSLGMVGHQATYFEDIEDGDQELGGWGGDYGPKGFMLLPDNGVADIGITEVDSRGYIGDLIDNCQVQTADGEIIRWWTQSQSGGRGNIVHLGKVLTSDHERANEVNALIDQEVN